MVWFKRSNKASRSQAQATGELLAMAIEGLTENVILFDAEDRVVIANRAWRELNKDIIEYTRPGTLFEDHLRAAIQRGLAPEAIGCEEEWLRARMERHRNPRGQFEIERQDGLRFRVNEQHLPNGGTILILTDITEAKRSDRALRAYEAQFRAVVDHSPTKIHIKDEQGRYVLINDLAAQLYGLTKEKAKYKTSHDIFPKERADAFVAHDRKVMETGQAAEQEEIWPGPAGPTTFLTVKFPIMNHNGVVAGVGAIGTDISERKRVEEKLRRSEEALQTRVADLEAAQRKLERQGQDLARLAEDLRIARDEAQTASGAKSEFLANMSHELRTPLNAIIGFSEIMASEIMGPLGSEVYRDYSAHIKDSGTHLIALINDILDLSKVEAGMAEIDEEVLHVPLAIDSVVRLLAQRADQAGIELQQEVATNAPDLRADERKFKQILTNLLSNAIKFTEPGGRVALRARCDAAGGYIIQVADTGIGMAPEDVPKALKQFVQVDNPQARKHIGTGLGLPLAKTLVELHGGTLTLESELGVGTTVTLCFPPERTLRPPSPLPASEAR